MKLTVIVILNFNPPFDSFYKLWTELAVRSLKKHPNIQFLFTTNHDNIELNTCQTHILPSGHAVYTTPDDKYRLITEIKENYTSALIVKTWNAIEFALQQDEKPDFILRTNACSIWNWEKYLKILENYPKLGVYSGIVGTYHGIQYASGACTLMSCDVAEKLITHPRKNLDTIDDVYIGNCLKKENILVQKRDSMRHDDGVHPTENRMNHYHIRFHSNDEGRLFTDIPNYNKVLQLWYPNDN